MSATLPFTVTPPLTSKLTSQGPPSQCVAPHPPCFLIRHLPYPHVQLIKPCPLGFPSCTCSVLCISTALSQVTMSYLDCCHAFCLVRLPQPCPNQPIVSITAKVIFPVGRHDPVTVGPNSTGFWGCRSLPHLSSSRLTPYLQPWHSILFKFCACLTMSSAPYLTTSYSGTFFATSLAGYLLIRSPLKYFLQKPSLIILYEFRWPCYATNSKYIFFM